MPCYHPIKVFYDGTKVIFNYDSIGQPANMKLPCGQCVGCRLERSRQWAVRIMHESSLYDDNCFITLTYDDEHLLSPSLDYKHFQDFMKRFRKRFSSSLIRFYMCGEYGDLNERPHFHACIFNFDFPDKKLFQIKRGNRIYISKTLMELWPFGFSTIGSLTFQSAAYVSRYVMKKVTGDKAKDYYERVDIDTGEVINLTPEFNKMSLKPGIGAAFFDKFHSDIFPHDYVIVNGRKAKPPRYYDKLYEKFNPDEAAEVFEIRKEDVLQYAANNTPKRLAVREEVVNARLKFYKREL